MTRRVQVDLGRLGKPYKPLPESSHLNGRARSLQAGPVQANLAARRAAEGLPAPAADLLVRVLGLGLA